MTKAEYRLRFDNEIAEALMTGKKSYTDLAKQFGVSHLYIIGIAKEARIQTAKGARFALLAT